MPLAGSARREDLPALAAASREDRPAGLRRHALTETVRLGALAVVWLVGALHGCVSNLQLGTPEREPRDYSEAPSGVSTHGEHAEAETAASARGCEKSAKSVDSVEKPGRTRARPVDNTCCGVVARSAPLVESASLADPPTGGLFLEKALLKGLISRGVGSLAIWKPSVIHRGSSALTAAFHSLSSPVHSTQVQSRSENALETPFEPLDGFDLPVRRVFDGCDGKDVHKCGKRCG